MISCIAARFLLDQTYMHDIDEFLIKCEQKYSCNTRKIDSDAIKSIYRHLNNEFDRSHSKEIYEGILQPVVILFIYMYQLVSLRIINQFDAKEELPEFFFLLELVLGQIFSANCMEALFPICMIIDQEFDLHIEEDTFRIFQSEFHFGLLAIDDDNPIGDRLFGEVAVDFDVLEERVFGKFKPMENWRIW